MKLFLYGPSGAGKSAAGKALARDLSLPFIDLDQKIEQDAGKPIVDIVSEQGIERLRELETQALRKTINESGREVVLSLGGGALLSAENRAAAESSGKIVLLEARISTLAERLQNDSNQRPLLAGDVQANLAAYLESRAEHYNSFPVKVNVDEKSPEQVAREIQTALGRHRLSAMGVYDIYVGQIQHQPAQGQLIVTDENIAKYHLQTIQNLFPGAKAVILPAGEESKNLETVSRLWKSFLENGLDRKSLVVSFGGGVISDLTGFAASTYMRGIDWIAIPTTLLAMADASLGGKTGFDLPEGKNLIGSFHPPKAVYADPNFLSTLTERDLRSGMAEVVKHGVITDPALFALCANGMDWVKSHLEEIVKRAMAVKIQVIEQDPYEKGIRAALNLGHTVGHAVELASKFQLSHGEAVSIGMAVEAEYSAKVGLASQTTVDAIESTLKNLGLPIHIPQGLDREEIIQAMNMDKKKASGSIRFALPVEIGKVELVEVANVGDVINERTR